MDSEVFRDHWDDFQKNRGYRPDVVRRVNAARREQQRRAEIKARKEARKAAKSPARPVAALMVPEFQARLSAARRVGTVFEKLEALTCIVYRVRRDAAGIAGLVAEARDHVRPPVPDLLGLQAHEPFPAAHRPEDRRARSYDHTVGRQSLRQKALPDEAPSSASAIGAEP